MTLELLLVGAVVLLPLLWHILSNGPVSTGRNGRPR